MNREPVLIWSSILVGLQILTAGTVLADIIPAKWAALAALLVAAAQGATQFYIRGKVTPVDPT